MTALSIVNEPPVRKNAAAKSEIGLPDASQTRNFTGNVLPPLRANTLVPSLWKR